VRAPAFCYLGSTWKQLLRFGGPGVSRTTVAGRNHPERAERFDAVVEGLAGGESDGIALVPGAARAATEEELLRATPFEYLRAARRDVESGRLH